MNKATKQAKTLDIGKDIHKPKSARIVYLERKKAIES